MLKSKKKIVWLRTEITDFKPVKLISTLKKNGVKINAILTKNTLKSFMVFSQSISGMNLNWQRNESRL